MEVEEVEEDLVIPLRRYQVYPLGGVMHFFCKDISFCP